MRKRKIYGRMKKGKSRVVKPSKRQTGKSNLKKDRQRHALAPGKRISRSGRIYYEYRKNRSDLRKREVPQKKRSRRKIQVPKKKRSRRKRTRKRRKRVIWFKLLQGLPKLSFS
jgi:hypothetical protein